jgi:hypothetical protein
MRITNTVTLSVFFLSVIALVGASPHVRRAQDATSDGNNLKAEEDTEFWDRFLQQQGSLPPTTPASTAPEPAPVPATPSPTPSPTQVCDSVSCPPEESCDPVDGTCKPNSALRPCIAVIDESDNFSDSNIVNKWTDFRSKYPSRRFCLLQPQNPSNGGSLYRPAAFDSDPQTTFAIVDRDDQTGQASDWLSICGITGSTGIDFVALFVDVSGSMELSTVQLSFDKFRDDLVTLGLNYCRVTNTREDWITPFDAQMATYDPVTGLCGP